MSALRRPLSWAIATTLVGLASAPAAHYHWEAAVFAAGGVAVVASEVTKRPRWRSILVWGWMLDAALLTMAGLMFRIGSVTAPSGPTALILCTVVGFGGAAAMRNADEPQDVQDG